jgi:transcriptional regulator with XRE-family HTH domain
MSKERIEGRNGLIWRRYAMHGWTQEKLAEHFQLSQSQISRIISEVRESIPPANKDEYLRHHLEALAEIRGELMELIKAKPIPAYSNGRPIMITDDDGKERVAEDHSGRITAMREFRAYLERESKALGIDAPTKLEASVALTEQEAATALAAEAAAYVDRDEP